MDILRGIGYLPSQLAQINGQRPTNQSSTLPSLSVDMTPPIHRLSVGWIWNYLNKQFTSRDSIEFPLSLQRDKRNRINIPIHMQPVSEL